MSLDSTLGALLPFQAWSSEPRPGPSTANSPTLHSSRLSDRYYSGGPNSLRGFAPYGIGPRSCSGSGGVSAGDSLGGDTRVTVAATLSAPVPHPDIAANGGRAILFINAGSICDKIINWNIRRELEMTRVSVGCGFTIPIGGAKLEVSYAIPLRMAKHDVLRGFQLGMSINYCALGSIN